MPLASRLTCRSALRPKRGPLQKFGAVAAYFYLRVVPQRGRCFMPVICRRSGLVCAPADGIDHLSIVGERLKDIDAVEGR